MNKLALGLTNTFCCRLSFGKVVGTMNKLANAMENGEYDFDGTHEKTVSIGL